MDRIEVDAVQLIDLVIKDCLGAGLPLMPGVLADVAAEVLCQRGAATERAAMFAQMLILIRSRVEILDTAKAPN